MKNITIPQSEYDRMKKESEEYQRLRATFFVSVVHDPIEKVVEDFRDAGEYSEEFLQDLQSGLEKSSYARA